MLGVPASGRRGAVSVEAAVVFPVAILLLLGLVVGGMGIFRYQQVAWLAREGARYASVRGAQYQQEVAGAKAATTTDVYNNAILPNATAMDPTSLSSSVTWNKNNAPYSVSSSFEKPVGNTVSVTVTYTWIPEIFFIGPITLSSTSTLPMSY
ncbi:MAG: pilus assembly protein [Planctomycetes bacterium]|nr:pilus assembly protein [Planctomycetota bacterium]